LDQVHSESIGISCNRHTGAAPHFFNLEGRRQKVEGKGGRRKAEGGIQLRITKPKKAKGESRKSKFCIELFLMHHPDNQSVIYIVFQK